MRADEDANFDDSALLPPKPPASLQLDLRRMAAKMPTRPLASRNKDVGSGDVSPETGALRGSRGRLAPDAALMLAPAIGVPDMSVISTLVRLTVWEKSTVP